MENEKAPVSDNDQSETINVIPVANKKQRVNDYYLEPDSNYDSYDEEDDEYGSEDDLRIIQFINNRDREIPPQELANFSRDIIDDLAEDKLTQFCRRSFRANIISWQDVLVIPERMRETTHDVTRG